MAKKNIINGNGRNQKLIFFWTVMVAITVVFAVLFVIRFADTRKFEDYNDIEKAKLNLVIDILGEDEEYYFVYVYSAKPNDDGLLIDTSSSDISKANEVMPSVLNYFNFVRRYHREYADIAPIYGYNVKGNSNDTVLTNTLDLRLSSLPALVTVTSNKVSTTLQTTSRIQDALQSEITDYLN